ncbi:hypothetical protein KFL_005680010, partial [Klebsormidium nitens]
GNRIGDEGARALAEALGKEGTCHALQTLDLHSNDIGVEGARALATALGKEGTCPNLQTLNLRYNQIGYDGAQALATALGKEGTCPNLQTLDLYSYDIGDEGAQALATALGKEGTCSNLQTLDLSLNQIGDEGARALATALGKEGTCSALQTLNLYYNQIGVEGARALATALGKEGTCPNLQTLDLEEHQIGDDGARALATAFADANARCLSTIAFITAFCLDLDDLFMRCARSRTKLSEWPLLTEGVLPALHDFQARIQTLEGPSAMGGTWDAWEELADATKCLVDGDVGMGGLLKLAEWLPWAEDYIHECAVAAGQPVDYLRGQETFCAAESEVGIGGVEFWAAVSEQAWNNTIAAALAASQALIHALNAFGVIELAGSVPSSVVSPSGAPHTSTATSPTEGQPKQIAGSVGDRSGVLGRSSPHAASTLPSVAKQHIKQQTIRILYATERERVPRDADHDGVGYTSRRRAADDGPFECGWVDLAVPEHWIEQGAEVDLIEIVRVEAIPVSQRSSVVYQEEVGRQLHASMRQTVRKEALVFVHGFATSFTKAVKRAAGLSAGLSFGGLTVVWDWPSRGALDPGAYISDSQETVRSSKNLVAQRLGARDENGCGFLCLLTKANTWAGGDSIVRKVHLIAHSMGNRVVFDGFTSHVYMWDDPTKVGQGIWSLVLEEHDHQKTLERAATRRDPVLL